MRTSTWGMLVSSCTVRVDVEVRGLGMRERGRKQMEVRGRQKEGMGQGGMVVGSRQELLGRRVGGERGLGMREGRVREEASL